MDLNQPLVFGDTETTGLKPIDPQDGRRHRIIEVGLVRLPEGVATPPERWERLHFFVDPRRDVPDGSFAVHGRAREDLKELSGGRVFADHIDAMRAFVAGAALIMHNAPFDHEFFDAEIAWVNETLETPAYPPLREWVTEVFDTLAYANAVRPGKRNGLDALAKAYHVRSQKRDDHSALEDTEILAEVFVAMARTPKGQTLASGVDRRPYAREVAPARLERRAGRIPVVRAEGAEREAHEHLIQRIRKASGREPAWSAPSP